MGRGRLCVYFTRSRYDLIFTPDVISKLADWGVAIVDSPFEVYPVLFNYLGYEPTVENADAIAAAETQMLAIRDSVRYFHSSRYIDDLASGEICVAYGFSGDIYQALNDSAEGVEISYVIPVEGTVQWADVMAIPADAPNPANAHQLINYLLEPAVMAGITNYVYYPNAVPASLPMVEDEVKNDPGIYPDAETSARLFPSTAWLPRFSRQMTRSWTKVRTGKSNIAIDVICGSLAPVPRPDARRDPPAARRLCMTEQAAKTAPIVRFENVVKRFGDVTAVDGVSLDIQRGELFSLLGGSCCGKTTLLPTLAGVGVPT